MGTGKTHGHRFTHADPSRDVQPLLCYLIPTHGALYLFGPRSADKMIEDDIELQVVHHSLVSSRISADIVGVVVVGGKKFRPTPVTHFRPGKGITSSRIRTEEAVHVVYQKDDIRVVDFSKPFFRPVGENVPRGSDNAFELGVVTEAHIVPAPDKIDKPEGESFCCLSTVHTLNRHLQLVNTG